MSGSIPWYPAVYMALTYISLAVACKCCMDVTGSGSRRTLGGIFFLWMYATVFFFHAVGFQFTAVAAVCGMGCVALLLPHGGIQEETAARLAVFGALFAFAFNIRPKVGYLAIAAMALAVAISRVFYGEKARKGYLAATAGIAVASYAANWIWERLEGWAPFRAYHYQRSVWTDYPHLAFDEAPSVYQEAGWTRELYDLASSWYFMDENVTAEAFAHINEASARQIQAMPLGRHVLQAAHTLFGNSFLAKAEWLGIMSVAGLLCCYCLYRKKWAPVASFLAFAGAGHVLALYLAWNGRIPYRVLDSLIFLFLVPGAILLLREAAYESQGRRDALAVALVAWAAFSIGAPGGMVQVAQERAESYQAEAAAKQAMEQYAASNPGNLYIYDMNFTYRGSPFTLYPGQKPYNLLFWGGGGMYSPVYYEQLEANGYNEVYPDDFFDSSIYFMFSKSGPSDTFLAYMRARFPGAGCTVEDEQEYFMVCHFTDSGVTQ